MHEFHDALGRELFPPDPAFGAMLFQRFSTQPDHLAIVYEDAGQPQGLLFAQAGWHDMSPLRVAAEKLWYVREPYRAAAWKPMLRAFEEWGREQGCTALAMVALSDNAAVGRIYERAGYRPVETHYLKKV